MSNIILPPSWRIKENESTPKAVYTNRRAFVKQLGLGTIALAGTGMTSGCLFNNSGAASGMPPLSPDGPLDTIPANAPRAGYPAMRNNLFDVSERPITDRTIASSYTNYYEFKNSGDLKEAWPLTDAYEPFPMKIKVNGHVEKSFDLDIAELINEMELEERIYRFRCVEAWAMTVPWTGFPLKKLIERCKPTSKATHVRFVSVNKPKQMPGIGAAPWYPWPYFEGLRMDEAMNDMAFMATGMYGEPLPKQNGAPMRMVLPWKYGYKGAKAITEIVFTDRQPPTFWNELQPSEYSFLSNVNPFVPHPRWSQASERLIGQNDKRVPTKLFNGYGEQVGGMYPREPKS
ncbi:MAG: protein-methionine-sulfoxide reductase catalytic subunit MsrP [Bacteroidota bacterium]